VTDDIKKWIFLSVGWTFIVLGILGLFLPILQGFLFLFIGFGILSSRSRWARRILARLRHRYPRQYASVRAQKEAVKATLRRWGILRRNTPESS
jgi:uncharacterized membrane protein YbaN (DUF454 family)